MNIVKLLLKSKRDSEKKRELDSRHLIQTLDSLATHFIRMTGRQVVEALWRLVVSSSLTKKRLKPIKNYKTMELIALEITTGARNI